MWPWELWENYPTTMTIILIVSIVGTISGLVNGLKHSHYCKIVGVFGYENATCVLGAPPVVGNRITFIVQKGYLDKVQLTCRVIKVKDCGGRRYLVHVDPSDVSIDTTKGGK